MPTEFQVDTSKRFFHSLQSMNTTGVFALFGLNRAKQRNFLRFGKDIPDLLKYAHSNKYNWQERHWWMCINSFRKHIRKTKYIVGLNGLWIDIDLEKHGIDRGIFFLPSNIIDICEVAGLPLPAVADSGHGAYFIWLFNKQVQVNNPVIEHLWYKLERSIVSRFNKACNKMYGAPAGDMNATDPSRVLRVPNTNNVKQVTKSYQKYHTGQKYPICTLNWIFSKKRYSMWQWIEEYIPKINRQHEKSKWIISHPHASKRGARVNSSIVTKFKIPKSMKWQRTKDLLTWLNMNHYDANGYREKFLFLYACMVIRIEGNKQTIDDISKINDKFTHKLPNSEIQNLTIEITHAHIENYKFKSKTIAKWLDITPKQQHYMLNLIDETEASRRRSQRQKYRSTVHLHKQVLKHKRNQQIIQLHKLGYSIRKIKNYVDVSAGTISNVIAKYKERAITKKYSHPDKQKINRKIIQLHQNDIQMKLISTKLNVSLAYIAKVLKSPS